MEYILISLIVLLIVMIVILIIYINRKTNNSQSTEELKFYLKDEYDKLKMDLINYVNTTNNSNKDSVYNISKNINDKFDFMASKLETNIKDNFKETNKTFLNVTERLIKLDEQNKNIESLSVEVLTLNNILTDKKTRGVFGEVQLNQILSSVFASNDKIYKEQYKLSNNKIVDAIIHAPLPLGSIGIDSKFPLETFNKIQETTNKDDLVKLNKSFKDDIKKHINDIKDKYIIKGETSDQAIMFIPAEGVYNELIKNHIDLVYYANENKVWITSPTSLLSTLTVISQILINIEKSEKTNVILEELKKLSEEYNRYYIRWNDVSNSLNKLLKELELVKITSDKLNKRFNDINDGKLNIE